MMFTIVLYILATILLIVSFIRDKGKTNMALKKAWKSFENILPQFIVILIMVGIILATISPAMISRLIGNQSGWTGMLIAAVIGAITLVPGFVAFPLAAALLNGGAGLMQITIFISTLMMVGVVTIPIEINYFGRKATFLRNGIAFLFSFIVALVIGVILR